MELDDVLWMLTALGAVVILLTRMRLSANARQSGHAQISGAILNAHTVVGVTTLVLWVYYLTSPSDGVGLVAIGLWWLEVIVGILILLRWVPGGGRHAAPAVDDSWASGPSLSILGHVGMLLGVLFFTYCVLAGKVT